MDRTQRKVVYIILFSIAQGGRGKEGRGGGEETRLGRPYAVLNVNSSILLTRNTREEAIWTTSSPYIYGYQALITNLFLLTHQA